MDSSELQSQPDVKQSKRVRKRKRCGPVEKQVYTTIAREHEDTLDQFDRERKEAEQKIVQIDELKKKAALLQEKHRQMLLKNRRVIKRDEQQKKKRLQDVFEEVDDEIEYIENADKVNRLLQRIQGIRNDIAALERSISDYDRGTKMFRREIDYLANVSPFLMQTEVEKRQEQQKPQQPQSDAIAEEVDAFTILARGNKRARTASNNTGPKKGQINDSRRAHLDEYLVLAGKKEAPQQSRGPEDYCEHCQSTNVEFDSTTSHQTCRDCLVCTHVMQFCREETPYTDKYETISESGYERINHFNEMLSQLQAKERTEIPEDIINAVRNEYVRKRKKLHEVTPDSVRKTLKFIKQPKYYEHVAVIAWIVSGIRPPLLTPEQEEQLRIDFISMQKPFEDCPISIKGDRINFLNYQHTLKCLARHRGIKPVEQYFSVVKSVQKFIQHERTLKWIFERLGWTWKPSVMRR